MLHSRRFRPCARWSAFILLAGTASVSPGQADKDNGERVFPHPQLALLDFLVGTWHVQQDHFDRTGKVYDTVKGTETITWALDKHALRREYRTKSATNRYTAIGYLTWNEASEQLEGVWLDNAGLSGLTTVRGTWEPQSRSLTLSVEGPNPDRVGERRTYKVIDRIESETDRVATTYLVEGSDVIKLLQVRYERATPCPGGPRVILDQ